MSGSLGVFGSEHSNLCNAIGQVTVPPDTAAPDTSTLISRDYFRGLDWFGYRARRSPLRNFLPAALPVDWREYAEPDVPSLGSNALMPVCADESCR